MYVLFMNYGYFSVIHPDNKFEVKLDKVSIHKGNLLEDFM